MWPTMAATPRQPMLLLPHWARSKARNSAMQCRHGKGGRPSQNTRQASMLGSKEDDCCYKEREAPLAGRCVSGSGSGTVPCSVRRASHGGTVARDRPPSQCSKDKANTYAGETSMRWLSLRGAKNSLRAEPFAILSATDQKW